MNETRYRSRRSLSLRHGYRVRISAAAAPPPRTNKGRQCTRVSYRGSGQESWIISFGSPNAGSMPSRHTVKLLAVPTASCTERAK